ncbi:MAG: ornithine carbamoyltransferase [Methanosarcina flavescens]|jgi:ornithine carbamoyltransferase|uniref:Ornithine carbamoyltransferase n=1 Tax=Methanosarcina flavescens TaxID=1715806 RepID=A0A660HPD8_9EURY|nr:ornithine carbamoyltransferase [Methanosarcina flavescens]AYK14123.1 ornithine carbamoyltransferase [Methanosarcina flavescens]NLK32324.1 ornithine carbamoyltransferase [Methanosarcina flavescens]
MKKDVLSITDLTREEIYELLESAADLKAKRKAGEPTEFLKNKSLGMIFEKSSTRTRVSFEVAMTDFGGHALYLNSRDIQIGRGETIEDTARILSGYLHGIMARVMKHKTVEKLAEYSTIPVINALSDREHPCQILGDFMTIMEYKKKFEGLKFAWVGDGNNVCNSALLGSAIMGMEFAVACPKGYEPKAEFLEKAKTLGGKFTITDDPKIAAKDADIIYTDVWVSMGDEAEQEKRLKDFARFQVNTELLGVAKPDVIVMHCLPARRGLEITDDVMDGPNSVIFDEAENRLHAQKALILKLMR